MKCGVIGLAGAATVAVVSGGLGYAADRIAAANYETPRMFGVAEVHPEFGNGVPADIQDARMTDGGTLQVLATGGYGSALSGLDVRETPSTVTVTVRVAGLPGDHMAKAIPWFVNVPLDSPLGDRDLVDTTTGNKLTVADCTATPAPTRGICLAAPLDGEG